MPRRLASYLLRETVGLYVVGVAAFCLLLSIDFLTVLAQFLVEQEASLRTVGELLLFKLPWFLHLALPVATVFAVLLATGRLAKDSELKAAYALGARPLGLLLPLVAFGLGVGALTVLNNGWVEPAGERAYNRLVDSFFYTRPPAQVQSNVSFGLEDAGIYFAAEIRSLPERPGVARLSGVLVLEPNGATITAPAGEWDSAAGTWSLEDAERSAPGEPPRAVGRLTVPFEFRSDVDTTLARRETLSLSALAEQLHRVRSAGGEVRPLRFELHRRLADALSAAVFALVAGTLGLGLHGRSAGFAWTIVLLVAFWAVWMVSAALFDNGVLGPVAAAWLTPALVGATGAAIALVRLRA